MSRTQLSSHTYERDITIIQRFPNFLGCGPLLRLNIFHRPHDGLANTKDI